MTPEQMKEIEQRWAKATPGPWQYEERENDDGMTDCHCITNGVIDYTFGYDMEEYDAAAIASAPTDIALLLAEVRRLNRMVEKAIEKLSEFGCVTDSDPCPANYVEVGCAECVRKYLESEGDNNG